MEVENLRAYNPRSQEKLQPDAGRLLSGFNHDEPDYARVRADVLAPGDWHP
jgi:hypothetical protein